MDFPLLVDGGARETAETLDVIDPATGEVFAACARASASDLDAAVEAAARAFPSWSETPLAERQAVLARMADAVEAEADGLARLLTQEQGKPLAEAAVEVGGAVWLLRSYAARDIPAMVLEDSDRRRVELQRRPLGVVAAIVPWNFPLFMAVVKISAALLAGNTVVLKPAPTTPLTTLRFGALVASIVPAGVLNIIVDANDLGARLTGHPKVRKISFTGSTQTGLKVMAAAAAGLKRVTLELGGNDAGIVLDDCDPAAVAPKLFDAAFGNNGQICVALKRLYVPSSLYDAVCDGLAAIAREAVVGPGLQQGTRLGPMQNLAQFEKVRDLIEETRDVGTIIAGGFCPEGPGYFIAPTIVRDIAEGTRLVDEEQFGPVLPVIRYDDLSEAIARINDTAFGLGNSVWSADPERARTVADSLEAGTVWINQHGDVGPPVPFGGAKMSGIGSEFGEDSIAELTQIKVVNWAKQPAV